MKLPITHNIAKTCTKCGASKNVADFSIFKRPDERFIYIKTFCKACDCKMAKSWYVVNREAKLERDRHKYANDDTCRSKICKSVRDRRKNNLIVVRKQDTTRYKTDPSKFKDRMRQWRINNHEKYLATNQSWRDRNPDKCKAKWIRDAHIRRQRIREFPLVPISLTRQMQLLAIAEARGVCPLCNERTTKWTIEHAIPLSRGGGHVEGNIYYCCSKCNDRKGAKTLKEFNGMDINDILRLND